MTKKGHQKFWRMKSGKFLWGKVKLGKFSTECENFSQMGENLKQRGMHHCHRGMNASAYTDTNIHNYYTSTNHLEKILLYCKLDQSFTFTIEYSCRISEQYCFLSIAYALIRLIWTNRKHSALSFLSTAE